MTKCSSSNFSKRLIYYQNALYVVEGVYQTKKKLVYTCLDLLERLLLKNTLKEKMNDQKLF